ncbi:MAG: ArnT family glycosyltransferase, partial [Anaerolineae bacterium]
MSDRVEFSRVVEHGKVFERIWIVLILLAAAVFRFTGIDWDEYHHYHPDERFITWVAATVEWPRDLSSAFIPSQSSFNPYYWPPDAASKGIQVPQNEPRKFAYGHFPLYAGVAATRLAERLGPLLTDKLPQEWLLTRDLLNGAGLIEFQHLTAVTRALTALVDVGTVWLLFLLGKQVYGVKTGLLAAAFLALNVMHIQLAHFFTFDPYMTFFVVAAIYFMVLAVNAGRETDTAVNGPPRRTVAWYLLLAGSSMGLAVGSKFSAILLILSLTVTVWGGMRRRRLQWLLAAVLAGVLSFLITNPFAALDFSCEVMTPAVNLGPVTLPAFNWKSCFLDNIATQGAMVRGRLDYPFTRQYAGTLPYLYYLEMQMRWGMGPLLGLVAFAGFVWAVWQEAKRLPLGKGKAPIWTMRAWREILHRLLSGRFFLPSSSLIPLILLSWTLPYFLTTGSFYVKFMRYLQPVVPFFMLYGAAMLVTGCKKRWRTAAILTTFTFTSLFA